MPTEETEYHHGCLSCHEVNQPFVTAYNGLKICSACGGRVLNTQELLDKVNELQSDLHFFGEAHEW